MSTVSYKLLARLRVFKVLNNADRISSIDFFRGIAIIAVVFYHFNHWLPYGYLGVDLFFVISGLLVGDILVGKYLNHQPVSFLRFFLQRGIKIWPSYYFFIAVGGLLAWIMYHNSNPDQVIPLYDLPRYVFFYQNYTGEPFHWSFDHVWSLCVEEHFYLLLPCVIIICAQFTSLHKRVLMLWIAVLLFITGGVAFKFFSFYFTSGQDTYAATHNRLDALGWGVLLAFIFRMKKETIPLAGVILFSLVGLIILVTSITVHHVYNNVFFEKIVFHSLVPFSFFLLLFGLYHISFKWAGLFRFIAYYSYNWYLWHPVFVIFCTSVFGAGIAGLVVYLLISFLAAFLCTIGIEELCMKKREAWLARWFKSR